MTLGTRRFSSPNVGSLWTAVGWLGILFLILPLLTAFIVSFEPGARLSFPPKGISLRWYGNALSNPEWYRPLERSLLFALCSSSLAVAIGVLAAYGLSRLKSWKTTISGLLMLPLLIPPVVFGVGQYFWFGRLHLIDTGLAVVLSHSVITFPIAFVLSATALSDPILALEDIACTLGSSRWYAFLRITTRSLMPTLAGAGFLCFVTAFDESVLALFLANQRVKTLPRQMFDGLRYDLDPTVAAIAGLAMVLWFVIIIALVRRSSRQSF